MDSITSMLRLMFLKGIGVGMVTALMSAVVYQVLFMNQYPNTGVSLAIQQRHAMYFFGGMGVGAVVMLALILGGVYLFFRLHTQP